jgi:hypothetical protein
MSSFIARRLSSIQTGQSICSHVELLSKPKDGFRPPEVTAAPMTQIALLANFPLDTVGGRGGDLMDLSQCIGLGGATVLQGEYDPSFTHEHSFK